LRWEASTVRELTFAGFLKQYVRSLSLYDTNGLYRLAAEAASDNPRLREPLFLYALFAGKERVLLAATKSSGLRREYTGLLEQYNLETMEQALREGAPVLPEEYVKVYRSYLSVKNGKQKDYHTKALMRTRIVRLQQEKGISTYRVYTDLRLNHGNMNAFIKHGDCSKVSLEAARSAVSYLEQL
jgi:hypothetical protein